MQALGYSDAEIAERLKLAPKTPAAPPANFKEFLEKAKDAPANVAQLKRPAIGDVMGEVKESYLTQNLDWEAAKKMAWMVAASCYQDAELCGRAGIDPNKGILFIGGLGTGKTTVFKECKKAGALRSTIVSCPSVRAEASKGGMDAISKYETVRSVVFDDLGKEGACSHYGTKIEPVADLILFRYDNWKDGKIGHTHFTTNLSIEQLCEYYDPRVVDRLIEMCNIINLSNKDSYRK
jgi:DNA replication protein DnaC